MSVKLLLQFKKHIFNLNILHNLRYFHFAIFLVFSLIFLAKTPPNIYHILKFLHIFKINEVQRSCKFQTILTIFLINTPFLNVRVNNFLFLYNKKPSFHVKDSRNLQKTHIIFFKLLIKNFYYRLFHFIYSCTSIYYKEFFVFFLSVTP